MKCVWRQKKIIWHGTLGIEMRLMAGVRKIKILDSEGAKEKNEFKRGRQNASIKRWKEKKCMVNFCGKCQRQLIKIRRGSGLGKVT